MNRIMDPAERPAVLEMHRTVEAPAVAEAPREPLGPLTTRRSHKVRTDVPIPPPPYLDRRVRVVPHLTEVWSYINPYMLYGQNLGYKGNFEKDLAQHESKALELFHNVEAVKEEAARFMKIRAVWQFFEAERDGNSIHLFTPGETSPLHTFRFGRQRRENGLCLSDYVMEPGDGRRDHIALFVANRRRRYPRARGRVEEAGGVFQVDRDSGAGHRDCGGRVGVAAPPHPRGLGLPRSAHSDDARPLHVAVSREAL